MGNRYSIVGTKFTGVPDSFLRELPIGTIVKLEREPANKFDRNAVKVVVCGRHVGYVPKAQNAVLARFMDTSKMAQDSATNGQPVLVGKFVRSPNSGFPQVEV